ncbi:SGNH/GDSL hydrolase family protein [Nocardia sp. NPDC051030]|uniref:SGNH/GDSL hydrolase family protein n=1 Tax=Nocardia sp. NPDC051030 TaxID=3155162 RepID=UPI003435DEAE
MLSHILTRTACAVTLASGTVLAAAPITHAAPDGPHYVALGDSFSAGAGVFPFSDAAVCGRSAVNYPALLADRLQVATFTDVSCSGATLDKLTTAQAGIISGANRPQLEALTPDTTLVTMTMGGNDIDLTSTAMRCVNVLPEPLGVSCASEFTAGGHDVFVERIAALESTYDRALNEIHSHAPQATVVIAGYPTVSRPGACWEQPAWSSDADYLQSILNRLNEMLRTVVTRRGDVFVDTATSTVGHDMCAAPDQQWVNGLIPSSSAAIAPLHPNARGEQNIADQMIGALHH